MPRTTSPQRRPAAPRWRRRAEERPDEILAAAQAEFLKRGFEAARMEDIATRAGLSKAAIYLYFDSKTAVLEALIETRIAPLARQAQAMAAAGAADPVLALRTIATAAAYKLQDANVIAIPRIVLATAGQFPEIAAFYRANVVEPARGALESLIQAGVQTGALRTMDVKAAARSFIGPLVFEALWTHVLRGETALHDPQTLIEHHMDLWLKGMQP